VNLEELARRMDGELQNADPATVIRDFQTDSRAVQPGDVFLAIKGAKADGHDFAALVAAIGAAAIVAERDVPGPTLRVESVIAALASLGRSLRDEFTGPVVGITGSNGKTTAKEFTAAALSPLGEVLKSAGNRNSEFTSPLAWFTKTESTRAAVIEMGMRGFDQIAHLASISRPTIGIITVIGTAHIEMVGSRAGIARAKGELFQALPADGVAIAWAEDDFREDLRRLAPGTFLTFGFSPEADLRILGYRSEGWTSCRVRMQWQGEEAEVVLPAIGRHQALNAAAATLAAVQAGVPFAQAVAALTRAELPPLRMEVREIHGVTLLLDNYNASPDSTAAALRALAEGPAQGRKLAVLGEMRELGDYTESGHRLVGRALTAAPIDHVFLTGGPTRFIADEARTTGFPADRLTDAESLDLDAVADFLRSTRPGDVVLIKGSRALELERAVAEWEARP
jgi:UDP-N-acetylmuramoyl-tripeptide--D-alanyl-D-alanine ligase